MHLHGFFMAVRSKLTGSGTSLHTYVVEWSQCAFVGRLLWQGPQTRADKKVKKETKDKGVQESFSAATMCSSDPVSDST